MSCITVPKTWGGSTAAAPRVESVSPVLPTATVRRRVTKKARATPQLVDTVREVVQAFEFEYAQVRAESVELKTVLDDRRTQLSDLRRHLENESSENGTLEAVVQHRSSKNDKGDARLETLEHDFSEIVKDDKAIAARAEALESDLGVFTQEHRRVREKTSFARGKLSRADAELSKREHAIVEGVRESERLSGLVQEGRRKVEDGQCTLRGMQDRASRARSLAKEAEAEAEAFEGDTVRVRVEVAGKESDSRQAEANASVLKQQSAETRQMMREEQATYTLNLRQAQNSLVDLKQQVDVKERNNVETEERIQAAEEAIAAEIEAQTARQGEIAAVQASRKETVEAQVLQLSVQLEAIDTEVTQAEEDVEQASDRMQEANTQFSNLMAAMSAAFREYDQAITTNRELERGATEVERALATVYESNQRELSSLHDTRDRLASSNTEDKAATGVHRKQAAELEATLRDVQEAVSCAAAQLEAGRETIVAGEKRLEEERERTRTEEEGRVKALRETKAAEKAAHTRLTSARARMEHQQSELIEVGRQAAAWTPPPATLSESDLRQVEEEARAAVQRMRAGDDEAHTAHLQSLEETLKTIREGGAARLKAEKDAAAARQEALQGKTLAVSRSLAELRSRYEAAQTMEAHITKEISRRVAEERRVAEAKAEADAAAKAEKDAAAKAEKDAAAKAEADAAAAAAATKAAAAQAAADAAAAAAQTFTSNVSMSSFTTPESRPANRSSGVANPQTTRHVPPNYMHQALGRRGSSATTDRSTSSFITPDTCSMNRSSGTHQPAIARTTIEHACVAQTPGRGPVVNAGGGIRQNHDRERSRSSHRPAEPARRSKKSGRSASKERAVRSQQASESTAEAAGNRKGNSSGRKHNSSGINGSSKHKRKDKAASRAPSKANHNSISDNNHKQHGSRLGGGDDDVHPDNNFRGNSSRKGVSKSKSKSPRLPPRSPRPANKEYDLWTDNKLVGDSDFSFF